MRTLDRIETVRKFFVGVILERSAAPNRRAEKGERSQETRKFLALSDRVWIIDDRKREVRSPCIQGVSCDVRLSRHSVYYILRETIDTFLCASRNLRGRRVWMIIHWTFTVARERWRLRQYFGAISARHPVCMNFQCECPADDCRNYTSYMCKSHCVFIAAWTSRKMSDALWDIESICLWSIDPPWVAEMHHAARGIIRNGFLRGSRLRLLILTSSLAVITSLREEVKRTWNVSRSITLFPKIAPGEAIFTVCCGICKICLAFGTTRDNYN